MQHSQTDIETREVVVTTKWSMTIIIFLVAQTAAAIWWASGIDSRVTTDHITIGTIDAKVETLSKSSINRDQLADILALRDQQITSVIAAVGRLEGKIDQLKK